jgi:hypothetical protein
MEKKPAANDPDREAMKESDIHDSPQDQPKLRSESVTMDLPDVNDIPGQENVELPAPHELGDPTVASADEEGEGLFDKTDNAADGTA